MGRRGVLVVALVLGLLSSVIARADRGFTTSGFAYDGYISKWHKFEGVPDASPTQQALHLEKVDPSASGPSDGTAGVGVYIRPVGGITISELGFDLRNDGLHFCGLFPRYKVEDGEGNVYYFPCGAGTRTASPEDPSNWTRIRFSEAGVQPKSPGQPPFFFGVTRIGYLAVGFRLEVGLAGEIHLDNLDINGILLGKPGSN